MPKKMNKSTKIAGVDNENAKYYANRRGDSKADNLQHQSLEGMEDALMYGEVVCGRVNDKFEIDINSIPDHVRDELASATLKAVNEFLKQSGGREKLDAITLAREKV